MEKHPEGALGQNKGLIHVQVSAEAVAYCSSPKRTCIQQTDCHYWLVHWDYQPKFSLLRTSFIHQTQIRSLLVVCLLQGGFLLAYLDVEETN